MDREINIWGIRAEHWGELESIKRIDFSNQKVELEESGCVEICIVQMRR